MSASVPGELELVREFVNTYDIEDDVDSLGTPEALAGWIVERGLASPGLTPTPSDVRMAAALREALRDHLLANTGAELPERSADTVEQQARRSGLRVEIRGGAVVLSASADGVDGALGGILAAVARSILDETWPRLKVCAAETCRWAYVDRSRNQSRHWCAMKVCGNREKVKAFRARQAGVSET